MKHQPAPRQTVGIRELKQNPSEVIARAASGVQFDVLSNGKSVGVVIQRDSTVRSRWVSTDALIAMSALAGNKLTTDTTGWADDLREHREQGNDPIIDPWDAGDHDAGSQDAGTA